MLREEIMKKIKREPLMNGFLTRKVGEIAVVAMEKKECTQRVLEILYFDYFLLKKIK